MGGTGGGDGAGRAPVTAGAGAVESRGKAGRDAAELGKWLETGGGGGASGGHAAPRVAVLCLVGPDG